jgi:hypothetical protein
VVFKRPISPTAHLKRRAPVSTASGRKGQVRLYVPHEYSAQSVVGTHIAEPPPPIHGVQLEGMRKLMAVKRLRRSTTPVTAGPPIPAADGKVVYVYSREATIAAGRARSSLCPPS